MMAAMYHHRNDRCIRPDRDETAAHLEATDAVAPRKPAFTAPANPFACLRRSHHTVDKRVSGFSVAPRDQLDIDFRTSFAGKGQMPIHICTGEPIDMRPDGNEICRQIRKGCFVVRKDAARPFGRDVPFDSNFKPTVFKIPREKVFKRCTGLPADLCTARYPAQCRRCAQKKTK